MERSSYMSDDALHVTRSALVVPREFDWGRLEWIFDGERNPGAAMTLGRCVIEPGRKNPLHSHPNCEEMLFLISGVLEHGLDGRTFRLAPGDSIRVPAGSRHDARNTGDEPAVMVLAYSHPMREMVVHE